jgi:hypothetical protein
VGALVIDPIELEDEAKRLGELALNAVGGVELRAFLQLFGADAFEEDFALCVEALLDGGVILSGPEVCDADQPN